MFNINNYDNSWLNYNPGFGVNNAFTPTPTYQGPVKSNNFGVAQTMNYGNNNSGWLANWPSTLGGNDWWSSMKQTWGDVSDWLKENDVLGWGQLGMGAYNSWNMNQMAKEQLALAKEQWNVQKDYLAKNYSNQISDYNRALRDIADNRAFIEGKSQSYADDYYNKNKLV